jgi:hypothetical protein
MDKCSVCHKPISTSAKHTCEVPVVFYEAVQPYVCPVCRGSGKVSRPPWVAGDIDSWTGTGDIYDCNACKGTGILWR